MPPSIHLRRLRRRQRPGETVQQETREESEARRDGSSRPGRRQVRSRRRGSSSAADVVGSQLTADVADDVPQERGDGDGGLRRQWPVRCRPW